MDGIILNRSSVTYAGMLSKLRVSFFNSDANKVKWTRYGDALNEDFQNYSLVVEDDVRLPNSVDWNSYLIDSAEQSRVPAK
jgi:hypothetical protein